jgi:bifunctional UDP-N-acetylglucosamine pyrophosphorylase/glucosamine-1-phosphate N-acetyltransferase
LTPWHWGYILKAVVSWKPLIKKFLDRGRTPVGVKTSELAAVILAAGQGKRMKSRIPKVLHPVAGRPMIHHVLGLAKSVGASPIVVVVGHGAEAVREALKGEELYLVVQDPQLGTGHAVMQARKAIEDHEGDLLILCGDMPLILPETISGLVAHHKELGCAMTVLVGTVEDPTGYGRVLRTEEGRVLKIVEEGDASPGERSVREVNSGAYCARPGDLFQALEHLSCANSQGEYYLTDAVEILSPKGVSAYQCSFPEEILGVNDRVELARAEAVMQHRLRLKWMREGVSLVDPASVILGMDVTIGRDTVIEPRVTIQGRTEIGTECQIGMGCVIRDSIIEDGVVIRPYSVITEAHIEQGATVGPFCHLRPGSRVGAGARVGNFVEMKNTKLGRKSKAPHLSYLGDAEIGEEVNIGAGTITCNYDGREKHKTIIEDRVFVGSDTQFVAPVRVMEGAVVGAGSTITEDVPPGALAIARSRQVNIPGKGRKRKGEES